MLLGKRKGGAGHGKGEYAFPGWEIEVGGKRIDFDYLLEGENYGLPVFEIPSGTHQVKAQFKNTQIRQIADMIGIVSLLILLVLAAKLLYVKK